VAAERGRSLDPEHLGVLVFYLRSGLSEAIAHVVTGRRPHLNPADVVPVGVEALRRQVQRFIDVGASKFVVVPGEEPDDWDAELGELADVLKPLET
jgi:hypothetical protein